jgi:hypothetical protein
MSQPLTTTSQSYILGIARPLEEFWRRVGVEHEDGYTLHRMIEHAWYGCIYPNVAFSGLMNLACRLKDREHPYAAGVMSFGWALQRELAEYGFYEQNVYLPTYHFVRRHGREAIIIKRFFEDHLDLSCPREVR